MDLKVFITSGESVCNECGEELGCRAWTTLIEGRGALCLSCAEQECLADEELRARRREREAERRAVLDEEYVASFAKRVRELFPRCPARREHVIAEHACLKYSGRVGRSASAKRPDEDSIVWQ
jgi:hypothetical protein